MESCDKTGGSECEPYSTDLHCAYTSECGPCQALLPYIGGQFVDLAFFCLSQTTPNFILFSTEGQHYLPYRLPLGGLCQLNIFCPPLALRK